MTVNITLESLRIILTRKATMWKRVSEARSTRKKARRVKVLMTGRKLNRQIVKISGESLVTRESLE